MCYSAVWTVITSDLADLWEILPQLKDGDGVREGVSPGRPDSMSNIEFPFPCEDPREMLTARVEFIDAP